MDAETKKQFDSCTQPLGPLRQSLFACLTCNAPTPDTPSEPKGGLCYSCSIACHGEHDLVELFSKRNFVCDCGSTRFPDSAPCTLRSDPSTGLKGDVKGRPPRQGNLYNHNFSGLFCVCGEKYDPMTEKGTMYQCLGLGTVDDGGCGEDWFHPECLLGLPRASPPKAVLIAHADNGPEHIAEYGSNNESKDAGIETVEWEPPQGFPSDDEFESLICFKCVDAHPWIKKYAFSPGFMSLSRLQDCRSEYDTVAGSSSIGAKRRSRDEDDQKAIKRTRVDRSPEVYATEKLTQATAEIKSEAHSTEELPQTVEETKLETRGTERLPRATDEIKSKDAAAPIHESLPPPPPGHLTLFLKENYRDHLCKCLSCFQDLARHPQLLEDEEAYEPPMSEENEGEPNGDGSVSAGSLLERGEAALSTMDRMRAIEGVMAYNHLKDKVKAFLQPFADSGTPVGAEDVKAYFAKMRGDEEAMRAAAADADSGGGGDNRREQSGY